MFEHVFQKKIRKKIDAFSNIERCVMKKKKALRIDPQKCL